MGIDRDTKISAWVNIDKIPAFLKRLEENNITTVGEAEHKAKPQYLFNRDIGEINTEEFYFDENTNEIIFSGNCQTDGEVYISFNIPISDILLIDILNHSIKKLSKLKTAMEALK